MKINMVLPHQTLRSAIDVAELLTKQEADRILIYMDLIPLFPLLFITFGMPYNKIFSLHLYCLMNFNPFF